MPYIQSNKSALKRASREGRAGSPSGVKGRLWLKAVCGFAVVLVGMVAHGIDTYATNMDFSINVKPSASITVPSNPVNLSINPGSSAFSSATLNIEAGTSYDNGYTIIMQSGHNTSEISNYNLVNTTDSSSVIPMLTTTYTEANFPANYWGVKVGSGNYGGVGTDGAISSTNTKGGSTVPVTLAAKVDYTKPAGDYTTTLNFSIIANVDSSASITNFTYMQDVANLSSTERQAVVDGMVESKTYTLKDSRDNQDYTIAKLKDGKVWMTKNLNLAGGTTLTSANTDMPSGYTLPTANGFQAGNKLPASAVKNTNDNNLTDATQFSDDAMAYVFNSGNTTNCGGNGQNTPCSSYYSWIAATLGSGVDISTNGTNAIASICPKGWRLPTSTTSNTSAVADNNWKTGDFYTLGIAYGASLENNYYDDSATTGANFYNNAGPGAAAPDFLLIGNYYSGLFGYGGNYGLYWSSTSSSSTNAYNLHFSISNVDSAVSSDRRTGRAVRCILDTEEPTIADLGTMQDFASLDAYDKQSVVNSMAMETNYTLKDSRDDQDYTIAKLKDGKVWMTKNLNLAGGTILTSANTDMPSGYTLPTANGFQSGNRLPTSETISSGTTLANSSAFSNDTIAYVFNSGSVTCSPSSPCYSYYSWTTATLGSGLSESGNGTDVQTASICPKGWRLPTSGNQDINSANSWQKGDFYKLATAYGANLESKWYENDSVFYDNAGPLTVVPNFLLAGDYGSGTLHSGGYFGSYWSSTSLSATSACYFAFNASVYSAASYDRYGGLATRCILDS